MILSIHEKLSMLKNLSMLEPNFEEADGLGIHLTFEYTKTILSIHKILSMLKNLSMLEPNFEEADGIST
jgi:hypothetical protein